METILTTYASCRREMIGPTGVWQFYVDEVTRKIRKKDGLKNIEKAGEITKDMLKSTILDMKKDHLRKNFKLCVTKFFLLCFWSSLILKGMWNEWLCVCYITFFTCRLNKCRFMNLPVFPFSVGKTIPLEISKTSHATLISHMWNHDTVQEPQLLPKWTPKRSYCQFCDRLTCTACLYAFHV